MEEIVDFIVSRLCISKWLKFDSISNLPPELKSVILSYLPSLTSVQTSLLSRAWRDSWKTTNRINIDAGYGTIWKEEEDSLVKFVDGFLGLHERMDLDEICVRCSYDKRFKVKIKRWIDSFLSRRVEKLSLDFRCLEDIVVRTSVNANRLVFPSDLCGCMCFSTLKIMNLKGVDIGELELNILMDTTPLIEEISVSFAFSLRKFKRTSKLPPFLKTLRLMSHLESFDVSDSGIIDLSLDRSQYIGGLITTFDVRGMGSVENLYLGGDFGRSFMALRFNNHFGRLLSNTLKSLTLSIPHAVGFDNIMQLPELNSVETLVVQTWSDHYTTSAYVLLIHKAPILKKFIFRAGWTYSMQISDRECDWLPSLPHDHLTEARIEGYFGLQRDEDLVRYFLNIFGPQLTLFIDPRNYSQLLDEPQYDLRYIHKNDETQTQLSREIAREQIQSIQHSKVKVVLL